MEELKDTVDLMLSNDYRDRFLAEFLQTKIRYVKLDTMLEGYFGGKLEFKPGSSIRLLEQQRDTMRAYLNIHTKLLRIYRSEIGGNDYEVMTDAQ